MKKIIVSAIAVMFYLGLYAQDPCLKLSDKTKEQMGNDATYITSFESRSFVPPIKKTESNKITEKVGDESLKPFEIILKKGIHYRITTGYSEKSEGVVVVKLSSNDTLIRSQETASGACSNFEFDCRKTDKYTISLSYTIKSTCCACIILSFVREPYFKSK